MIKAKEKETSKMSKTPKTTIKEAHWKIKDLFGRKNEFSNIYAPIYYQGDDAFIETDSKLLFEMICNNFFYQYEDVTIEIKLKGIIGAMFPEAYKIYLYNLIYKKLTNKKIKDDIFKANEEELLSYGARIYKHLSSYQKRVLEIIEILGIDFKVESERMQRVLFNKKGKKDFYICDVKD